MTNEERDIISQFIARVGGGQGPQAAFGGSVPATTGQPPLPPVDREADQLLANLFTRYPDARYRITQLAYVQEHALVEAQNRIQRLEWEVQQAQQTARQAAQQQQDRGRSGGLFGSLFGGGNRQAPPAGGAWNAGGPQGYGPQGAPPPPQYPPNYQPGMFQQRGGSGFLGSALTTAAGVAGGMVAGNALMSLFSGGHGMGGGMLGGAGMPASPWATGAGADPGAVDQGTWGTDAAALPAANQDYVDQGTWDQPAPDTSWTDTGGGSGGGSWDSGGGSSSSDDDTF